MRARYFLTIFGVLFLVSTVSVALHATWLAQARLELIDQQLRETATALIDSELAGLRIIDFDRADEIISEEIGENRIGKFFVIRNGKGEVVFESASAKVLPVVDVPQGPRWATLNLGSSFVRVLNLQLPRVNDRTLQVGAVLPWELLAPDYFSRRSLGFGAALLLLGLVTSWLLTSFLLDPIARLSEFLTEVSDRVRRERLVPGLPQELRKGSAWNAREDEYGRLLTGLDRLIARVNLNYQMSRQWAYQMAHELKTPLAVMALDLEKSNMDPATTQSLQTEVRGISETINSFLAWAELEAGGREQPVFASRVLAVIETIRERAGAPARRDRVALGSREGDFWVLAARTHLEQLLGNLIQNALNYSPPGSPVVVDVVFGKVTIRDGGPGVPAEVLDRLGEPFNRGHGQERAKSGHGLGLAWVSTIADHYGWKLSFLRTEDGGEVTVEFPGAEPLENVE